MSDVVLNKETPMYKTILPNISRAMFDTDLTNTRLTLAFAESLGFKEAWRLDPNGFASLFKSKLYFINQGIA